MRPGSTGAFAAPSGGISRRFFYEDKPDHVRIVAVMPMQRDPDYWTHRFGSETRQGPDF